VSPPKSVRDLPLRQHRNDAESLWWALEQMSKEERAEVSDEDAPTVTPRLAGYVCRLLKDGEGRGLDPVNNWERFSDVPVPAVFRLVLRYRDATTEQARGKILYNFHRKHTPEGWVGSGWTGAA
jgi:hypothetical protein